MMSQKPSPGRPASVALAVGLLFVVTAPEVRAAEVAADSRIAAVTVFPDRAQVTRLIEVPLPAGDSTLVVSGLPAGLLGDSLRVEGEGSARLLLGAVEARTRHGRAATREEERRLQAEIEALGDRRRLVTDRIAALKFKQGVIEAVGVEFPKTRDEDGESRLPDPETWIKAWNALGEGSAQVRAEIAEAEVAARALDREIAQKQRQLSQIATGATASSSNTPIRTWTFDGKSRPRRVQASLIARSTSSIGRGQNSSPNGTSAAKLAPRPAACRDDQPAGAHRYRTSK